MGRSIHDNWVYAYAVERHAAVITLYTEYESSDAVEYTDVVFRGVVAHYFDCEVFHNYLLSIAETDPREIYKEYEAMFEECKAAAWPFPYDTAAELFRQLKEWGTRGYCIQPAYGLMGWVWAASMELRPRTARKEFVD